MQKNRLMYVILLLVFALVISSLACNLPIRLLNPESEPTPTSVIVPDVQNTIPEIDVSEIDKRFTVRTNEVQLTALLISAVQSNPEIPVSDPRIYLRDGNLEIHGSEKQTGWNLPFKIVLRIYIDQDQRLAYEMISANIGPLPMPSSVTEQLSSYLEQSFTSVFGFDPDDVKFEEIIIADGSMIVTGYYL